MFNPLSHRKGITFTWQNGRQLASLQTADNNVSYNYSSNGMRTQKTDNSGTTYYYYDSGNNLIGMTKGNNTLLFYYDSDGNVTSFKKGGTMYYLFGAKPDASLLSIGCDKAALPQKRSFCAFRQNAERKKSFAA